jgi:hypothetical protein
MLTQDAGNCEWVCAGPPRYRGIYIEVRRKASSLSIPRSNMSFHAGNNVMEDAQCTILWLGSGFNPDLASFEEAYVRSKQDDGPCGAGLQLMRPTRAK